MQQPLAGIRVLDFSTLLPGPMATLMLARAGAEVIKIEPPEPGESMRRLGPRFGPGGLYFSLLNQGKRSISLDLKAQGAGARLKPLLESADVLVEQFRPVVMGRLGLSYEEVRRINPRLVYCSITGYGQHGEFAARAGHDLNYQADTGMLGLTAGSDGRPGLPQGLVADIAGGTYPAVINILLALAARDKNGGGCHLDISMSGNLFAFMYWALGEGHHNQNWPRTSQGLFTGGSPRYQVYATADGNYLAAAPLEDRFWLRFCELIELEEEFRDDAPDPQVTRNAVAKRIAARSADHWQACFEDQDVCCCLVKTLQEVIDTGHFAAYSDGGGRLEDPEGRTIPDMPLPIAAQFRVNSTSRSGPELGEGNRLLDEYEGETQ